MMIALDDIVLNGNMRRQPSRTEDDEALSRSIAALGVLQPVLVRPNPDGGYLLIAGYRRVKEARRLALREIPGEVQLFSEIEAEAAQAAENMVRAPVDPVDEWRHICRLIDDGYTLTSAGAALGLTDRRIGQLSKLGRLSPALLDQLSGRSLPRWKTLGEIAQASHEAQEAALKRFSQGDYIIWNSIAAECIQRRIPRNRAIFDVEASGIPFDEDYFAEPDSDDQFTTTHLIDFMVAQKQAVQQRIAEGVEPAMLVEFDEIRTLPKIPAGWTFADFGRDKTLTKRSRHKRLYAVVPATDYHDGGSVKSIIIKPITAEKTETTPKEDDGTDEADPYFQEDATLEVAEEPDAVAETEQLTKAGMDMLASIRESALRNRLRSLYPWSYRDHLMAALVIQLVGARYDCQDLVAAIMSPDGAVIADAPVDAIAAEALARTVEIVPKHRQTSTWKSNVSYLRCEWIGTLVEADMAMPRLDTPEILAHVGGAALQKIATDHLSPDIPKKKVPKKVSDLRHFLAGKAEHWQPVSFGAPAFSCEPWSPVEPDDEQEAA